MKVTKENLEKLPESERLLMSSLLDDIEEINTTISGSGKELYIDRQDYHDEYSPERTDPCPDYYGYYRIIGIGLFGDIGWPVKIDDLDYEILVIADIVRYIWKH